ncbi:hypothetical protein RMCBS344292_14358 [Rhizopus microsporus]|nr:hypothetical protein RMCBS344292_14358 [Rhizopus microsporus]
MKCLEEFIDNNSVVTLDKMVDALNDKLDDRRISKSGVDKHLKESCSYRFRVVEAWIKDSNISFMQNCIFIDESGLNLHTVRSQG